jgi:hypothetical protein
MIPYQAVAARAGAFSFLVPLAFSGRGGLSWLARLHRLEPCPEGQGWLPAHCKPRSLQADTSRLALIGRARY